MKISSIVSPLLAIAAIIAISFSSCKRINEATDLGGGLIPPVDNINTFDTTLEVQAYNNIFTNTNDSQYISREEEFFLGKINSDPFFGKTDARIFLELKPTFYKFAFANSDPTKLRFDSVVLVLDYVETYGDSTIPQTVSVYELDNSVVFRADSAYLVRQNNFTYGNFLGSRTFAPQILDDSIKAFRDTTKNQMRIKLTNNAFINKLKTFDSTATGAYSNDSIFRDKFKGFAIQSTGAGDALMGFNLQTANTKLAIYYHFDNATVTDSATVAYFGFNGTSALDPAASASANYITRDYSGTPVQATSGDVVADPFVYIQNSPGTYATLKIPALATLSNRLIHRAELVMEQQYDVKDTIYRTPAFLYVDAFDPAITANKKFRAIPYDVNFSFTDLGQPQNLTDFGVSPVSGLDASGNNIHIWKFNLSRYVQHILTHTSSSFDLRVYSPFSTYNRYNSTFTAGEAASSSSFLLNPTLAKGRVRLVGSTGPLDPNPHRIRLHIIYSKL